jgi:hypothetical protein
MFWGDSHFKEQGSETKKGLLLFFFLLVKEEKARKASGKLFWRCGSVQNCKKRKEK